MLWVANDTCHYKVRRLSTPPATSGNNSETFNTQWLWYWFGDGVNREFNIDGVSMVYDVHNHGIVLL